MPTLPPWARGGRIVYDADYNLAFVRTERRGDWRVYTVYKDKLRLTEVHGRVLARTREKVFELVGESLKEMIQACHPAAVFVHQSVSYRLACGAPLYLTYNALTKNVTCPTCLAVLAEDVVAQAKKIGHESVQAARRIVVGTRETNALGKLVTGETATEHDL